jgi:hypothetical protein
MKLLRKIFEWFFAKPVLPKAPTKGGGGTGLPRKDENHK